MAGARIEIEYLDQEVTSVLQQLLARVEDPQPANAQVAEYGVQSTRARIESQNADDPIAPWEPLSPSYLHSKRKQAHHPDEILVLYGYLVATLAWQADATSAAWGSNQVYAAAQQFGRPEIGLPGRPYLGVTEKDKAEILAIYREWIFPAQ